MVTTIWAMRYYPEEYVQILDIPVRRNLGWKVPWQRREVEKSVERRLYILLHGTLLTGSIRNQL
jgi:hypothetical protein